MDIINISNFLCVTIPNNCSLYVYTVGMKSVPVHNDF